MVDPLDTRRRPLTFSSPPAVVGLAALAAFAAFFGGCSDGPAEDSPFAQHVVLITCDTLRADRLGAYGSPHDTTPNLDRFAQGSKVFERAYSCAPMTLPSVCSMLTGRLPVHNGVVNNFNFLHKQAHTLAEELASHGLTTAAVVSNWVLVNSPELPSDYGIEQGFDHFDDTLPGRERVRKMPERNARDTTDAAIRWLDTRPDGPGERFFLWVHYQDPHGPYTAPPRFVEMMQRPIPDEPLVPFSKSTNGKGGIPTYQRDRDEQRPEVYRIRYDAEVRFFDLHLGRLLDYLSEEGLLERSLVIFSADHGESLGEQDYWFCHGETLNHELVHVPLIVRPPGGVAVTPGAAPQRERRIASQLDIWPTVLAGLGLAPGDHAGSNLLAPTAGGNADAPIAVQMFASQATRTAYSAIVDGDYRLHFTNGQPDRLYNRAEDPEERNNLIDAAPDVVARLHRRYFDVASPEAAEALPQDSQRSLSAEDLEILESLGYSGGDDEED